MAKKPPKRESDPLKARYKVERAALVNARHRCHNPEHKAYYNYGARGITVCDAWRDPIGGFAAFIEHIGPKPSPELTLDRIDNDKGYEPGNVAWRTRSEQQCNRRHSTAIQTLTIGTVTLTIREWSEQKNTPVVIIRRRMQLGWDNSRLFDPIKYYKPSGKPRKKYTKRAKPNG